MGKLVIDSSFLLRLVLVAFVALVFAWIGASCGSDSVSLEDRVYLLEFSQGLSHNPSGAQLKQVKKCERIMATAATGAMSSVQAQLRCRE